MINLREFVNLCNLENHYCFISHEESRDSGRIILTTLPNENLSLEKIEKWYDKIVTNVIFYTDNNSPSILIEVK